MKIKHWIHIFLTGLTAMLVSSCVREELLKPQDVYEEGLATRISLRIGIPERSVATRSDMPNGLDDEVKSLWVGIFSAKGDGECTFAKFYSENEIPANLQSEHGEFAQLTINAVTGPSYIVAVANPVDNYGYQYLPSSADDADRLRRQDLYNPSDPDNSLLPKDKAAANSRNPRFTWEIYKNIAIRQLALGDVNTPVGNLVMSGIYYESKNHPITWEEANYTPVDIRPDENLDGAIHLRRLISQVRFNIKAEPYNNVDPDYPSAADDPKYGKQIIEIMPQSFQVRNVPYTSWLHERKGPSAVSVITNPD